MASSQGLRGLSHSPSGGRLLLRTNVAWSGSRGAMAEDSDVAGSGQLFGLEVAGRW